MITDSYDDQSPAKINVKKNENAIHVDAVIYTFSQAIEKYVISHYDCQKIGEYAMACGATSVYMLRYHGKKFGFFRTWVGAPACIVPIEELSTVLDTDKIIHYGGAGCLNKEIARGKVMIPTEAYRDEGTSYHYAPASDYIRIKNHDVIKAFMEENKIPYVMGGTWTTDTFYRETVNTLKSIRLTVASRLKWKERLFRRSVISGVWKYTCSLQAEIYWMHRNGQTEQYRGRSNTRNMIRDILTLLLRSQSMW